jgi:hypothetical protein
MLETGIGIVFNLLMFDIPARRNADLALKVMLKSHEAPPRKANHQEK